MNSILKQFLSAKLLVYVNILAFFHEDTYPLLPPAPLLLPHPPLPHSPAHHSFLPDRERQLYLTLAETNIHAFSNDSYGSKFYKREQEEQFLQFCRWQWYPPHSQCLQPVSSPSDPESKHILTHVQFMNVVLCK